MIKKYITQYPDSVASIPAETKYVVLYDNSYSEHDYYARAGESQSTSRKTISVMTFVHRDDLLEYLENNKNDIHKLRVIPWNPTVATIKHKITIEGLDNV